jgi:hypothetical protein
MNWKQILLTVAPLVLAQIPQTRALAPIVPGAIATAEDMLNASGAEKKAAAMNLVTAGVTATNVAAGREVIDPRAVNAVASSAIDTIVATTNLLAKSPVTAPATV